MAGGGCVRVGETVWNTLKEGGTKKMGGETKILKGGGGGGQPESKSGRLKNGMGLEAPYELS